MSEYRPLWNQEDDSDIEEWIRNIGGWIRPEELEQKKEGKEICKPESKLPEPEGEGRSGNGWGSESEDIGELEAGSESVAAINSWDSSEDKDSQEVPDLWEETSEQEKETKKRVNGMTRSGRHCQDERNKGKEPEQEREEADNDLVLRQLKRTQAQASV